MSVKLAVTGALSALAVGAVSVLGVNAAADEPSAPTAASAPVDQEQDVYQPSLGGPDASGEHGEALEQLMADHLGAFPFEIPADLQDDLARAAGNGDAGDRLTALADVHDRALAGDYGAQVRQMVEGLGRMLDQMGGAGGAGMLGGLTA